MPLVTSRPPARATRSPFCKLRRGCGRACASLVAFLVFGNVAILGTSLVFGAVAPASDVPADVPGVSNLTVVDDRVWRGAAPDVEGYEALRQAGVTTVVDLRAEDDAAELDADVEELGLELVRLPVRDGQLPTDAQIAAFAEIVAGAPGRVFLHCGAGVGRTGAMAAAYLVRTGRVSAALALARNLAVGPPSLEQIAFVVELESDDVDRPPAPLVAVSRVLDAPRRIWSVLS